MKKTIAVFSFIFIIVLIFLAKFLAPAYSDSRLNSRLIEYNSRYSPIFKKLYFYKKELALLSVKILKRNKSIKKIKNKIKNLKSKIKNLKNKIKRYGLIIRNLAMRIFLISEEHKYARLLSFKGNDSGFILKLELKAILKKEELKLFKLVRRKNKLLKLEKYEKIEKKGFVSSVKSLRTTKAKLALLIKGIYKYINSLKKTLKAKYANAKNNIKNKKNRLLKRKVIKLMHNINKSAKNKDIKFIILR